MFQKHDHVVHPKHGVGTITGTRTVKLDGKKRRYYCIELLKNDSTVMISAEHLEESGLRPASVDEQLIRTVMSEPANPLPDNNRERENYIGKRFSAESPETAIRMLRDILCYGLRKKLSSADRRFRDRAKELIANELALHAGLDVETARNAMEGILSDMLVLHAPPQAAAEA
ncbi:MAG: CarD family transcriptional regulator [Anaerolineae bacterium]